MDLAIITARGGSKRIPAKNLREFCGRPIIEYSIEAALDSRLFDCVMVSTDCENIARAAIAAGASVPFMRSAAASDDFATTSDVLVEVLNELCVLGERYERFCCLYPTAPFITSDLLKKAARMLEASDADSVIPVVKYGFPPQRAFSMTDGFVSFLHPELSQRRSQDLDSIYHDCGQFYYCKTDSFLRHENMVMPKTLAIEQPEILCQDIDNEADWFIAEMKYRAAKERGLL